MLRVGAVYWDGAMERGTYFGDWCANSLSPSKYRTRTPFYADVEGDNKISFHKRTQEEYDTELQYAKDSGIDYFAHVWYGEEKLEELGYKFDKPGCVSGHVWELSTTRKLHKTSRLRNDVKMCAMLSAHPFTDKELKLLVCEMKESYYEKKDGHPLVYLYSGYDTELMSRISAFCKEADSEEPCFAFLAHCKAPEQGMDYSVPQCVSDYTYNKGEYETYEEHIKDNILRDLGYAGYGLQVIPQFSAGWNPEPRMTNPVPWVSYPQKSYPPVPDADMLCNGGIEFGKGISKLSEKSFAGHVIVFAWNEFEEGGFLCPTWRADGKPDDDRLKAFKKVAEYWKNNLI